MTQPWDENSGKTPSRYPSFRKPTLEDFYNSGNNCSWCLCKAYELRGGQMFSLPGFYAVTFLKEAILLCPDCLHRHFPLKFSEKPGAVSRVPRDRAAIRGARAASAACGKDRLCLDCPADISHRHHNCVRCILCHVDSLRKRSRDYQALRFAKIRADPKAYSEFKKKARKRTKTYSSRPDVAAKIKRRNNSSEGRERHRTYMNEWRKRPRTQARTKIYNGLSRVKKGRNTILYESQRQSQEERNSAKVEGKGQIGANFTGSGGGSRIQST